MADALVELCEHALDTGTLPQHGSQRPHLQVTCAVETLQGLPGSCAGELDPGGRLSATAVQRIACDASVVRVVLDASSPVLDVGRARRVPSGAARRALRARDRGCVWPGCDRPASWTRAHHLVHWARGGKTDMANLVLLCARHHFKVHEGGWRLVRGPDGTSAFPPETLAPWQAPLLQPPARAPVSVPE